MTQPNDSLTLEIPEHDLGYITVRCDIGRAQSLEFMLHTGRPLSYLSVDLYERLERLNLCTEIGAGIHRVRGLVVAGQPMRNLFVRVSAAPGILNFDGILGLHFLDQFSRVAYERDNRLLTLIY